MKYFKLISDVIFPFYMLNNSLSDGIKIEAGQVVVLFRNHIFIPLNNGGFKASSVNPSFIENQNIFREVQECKTFNADKIVTASSPVNGKANLFISIPNKGYFGVTLSSNFIMTWDNVLSIMDKKVDIVDDSNIEYFQIKLEILLNTFPAITFYKA